MKPAIILLFALIFRCQSSIMKRHVSAEELMNSMFGENQKMKDSLQEKLHQVFELEKIVGLRKNNSVAPKLIRPVVEGDILVNHKFVDNIIENLGKRQGKYSLGRDFKTFYTELDCPRHQKEITYFFDENDSKLNKSIKAWIKQDIEMAISFYQSSTCLKFREVPRFYKATMVFTTNFDGCFTYICQFPTRINIALPCVLDSQGPGISWHEIGHALGMIHEHKRQDRDKYVHIDFNNMNKDEDLVQQYRGCFESMPNGCPNKYPYDFSSLMQYAKIVYVESHKRNVELMRPKLRYRHYTNTMGIMTSGPTFYDTKNVNDVYCNKICSPNVKLCTNGGYANPADCNKCLCPSGFGGRNCSQLEKSSPGCSEILNATKKWNIFKTPANDKEKLVGDLNCVWLIETEENAKIQFQLVTNFKLNQDLLKGHCYLNYLEIKYRADLALGGAKFCGPGPVKIISQSNRLIVRYKSELRYSHKSLNTGLIARYRKVYSDAAEFYKDVENSPVSQTRKPIAIWQCYFINLCVLVFYFYIM